MGTDFNTAGDYVVATGGNGNSQFRTLQAGYYRVNWWSRSDRYWNHAGLWLNNPTSTTVTTTAKTITGRTTSSTSPGSSTGATSSGCRSTAPAGTTGTTSAGTLVAPTPVCRLSTSVLCKGLCKSDSVKAKK